MLMSIVPAWAQYSFKKVIGGNEDDRPCGMMQARDGYFYLYGSAGSFNPNPGYGNQNYIAKIDHLGNIIWQRTFTKTSTVDYIDDVIELPDGTLFCGGSAQEQLQELNARVTLIKPNGDIVLDSLYPHLGNAAGTILKLADNPEKKVIVSIGLGGPDRNTDAMLFQRTDYSGKRLFYTFVPYPTDFRIKKFFKIKGKDEYMLFGIRRVLHLDSVGNVLPFPSDAMDTTDKGWLEILDVVQNDDGTYTCVMDRGAGANEGYYLQLNDSNGKFIGYQVRISSAVAEYYTRALTKTRNKGYLSAGAYLTLIDSNMQIVWQKKAEQPSIAEMVSVGQALDGGFYGCAYDYTKNNSLDNDMYIYKTNADGVISGLNDAKSEILKAQVVPNPSAGLFTITGEFKQAQVSVSNLLGQELLKTSLYTGETLDASQLNPGLYMLTLTSGNASAVQRVSILK